MIRSYYVGAQMVKSRLNWIEMLLFAGPGLILVLFSCLTIYFDLFSLVSQSGFLVERSRIISLVLMSYGFALAALGLSSFFVGRCFSTTLSAKCMQLARSVLSEFCNLSRSFCESLAAENSAPWVILIIVAGLVVRGYFLNQPMRYDEAFTFLNFVNNGLANLFYYPLPNNHVLHTLLVQASVDVFGNHPFAIRLPALLAGVSAIPLSFWFSRLLLGNKAGYLTATLVALCPYLILFDTMARGYSIVVMLSLFLAIVGLRFASRPSPALCFLMSLLAALGLFAIPSFLFPAFGLFIWVAVALLIRRRNLCWIFLHFVMPCGLMTLAITFLFYTPTIIVSNGVDSLVGNRFVSGLPWPVFLGGLPDHVRDSLSQFSRDVPAPLIVCLLILIVFGLYFKVRLRQWEYPVLFPSLTLGAVAVLFTKHAIPFDRTWIYLLPFLFVNAEAGFEHISKTYIPYIKVVLLLFAMVSVLLLIKHNIVSSYPDTGSFREAPFVANLLSERMDPGDKIVVECPADAPLYFYLRYQGVPKEHTGLRSRVAKEFFVVKKSSYSLSDLTKSNAQKIFELGDAEVYMHELPE